VDPLLADLVLNVGVLGGAALAVLIGLAVWRVARHGLLVRIRRDDDK